MRCDLCATVFTHVNSVCCMPPLGYHTLIREFLIIAPFPPPTSDFSLDGWVTISSAHPEAIKMICYFLPVNVCRCSRFSDDARYFTSRKPTQAASLAAARVYRLHLVPYDIFVLGTPIAPHKALQVCPRPRTRSRNGVGFFCFCGHVSLDLAASYRIGWR